jgi:hypothetical protein
MSANDSLPLPDDPPKENGIAKTNNEQERAAHSGTCGYTIYLRGRHIARGAILPTMPPTEPTPSNFS